ncbi:vomeronasal type-2 receptor 26-like [Mantella aurantiaca]
MPDPEPRSGEGIRSITKVTLQLSLQEVSQVPYLSLLGPFRAFGAHVMPVSRVADARSGAPVGRGDQIDHQIHSPAVSARGVRSVLCPPYSADLVHRNITLVLGGSLSGLRSHVSLCFTPLEISKTAKSSPICPNMNNDIIQNLWQFYHSTSEQTTKHVYPFLSAIQNVNQNPDILPNITLGFHVLDSCLHPTMTVRNVLSILSGPQKTVPNYSCSGEGQLVGFIGDNFSVTTIPMAQMLGIYGYTQVPVSRCSGPCLPGSRKKFGSSIHKCCYECIPCPEGEISNSSDSENCMKCPDDEWPIWTKDQCVPKLMEFLSYTDDTISVIFLSVSIIFSILVGLILGIFVHYQDTPVVKANNRNLSYVLLVSIMLSFLCVFLFLGRPVDVTCMLRVTSFGVIFSVAVSSLLAKSIMVCIAFKATKPGSPWRKWMGCRLPNSIMCMFSMVQVIVCVTWLSISPPFQDKDTHSYQGKIIIQCNEGSVIGFYTVLGYMGLLASVSFIIAFLARTLPDSFNEAKYITFSMLVFCSVWIAMIPAYLSTKGKYMVAVEIFAIMASSIVLLGCIFFPKCYIILFRPELNTKTGLFEMKG